MINSIKDITTIIADKQNMNLRNILDIITEGSKEVKPMLPEANPGGSVSDLTKTNAKFYAKNSESSLGGMINSWEVETLPEFLKDEGIDPSYIDTDTGEDDSEEVEDEENQVNEYWAPRPREDRIDECDKCSGLGMVKNANYEILVCDECLGWGEFVNGRTVNSRNDPDKVGEVAKLNKTLEKPSNQLSLFDHDLGKDGKEPAVKYKDSTEADLADRMFRSKGPKSPDRELADKDEGPNARELRLIQQLSGQKKIDEDELDEVIDAPSRKIPNKELNAYLDRILSKQKGKTDKYKLPYVHRSNIVNKYQKDDNILASDKQVPIVDPEGQEFDLNKLAADITVRPAKLLSQNEKMKHSETGKTSVFFNIGLPALTGLAYNEEKKEFVVINTCPGAGECKTFCYALKNGYVQWAPVSLGQTRRLNWLYNDPAGFFDQLNKEIDIENNKSLVKDDPDAKLVIRWHDAGDFFSDEYLDFAYKLAAIHPNVDFYAYTKRADVSGATKNRPGNFIINFSMGAAKGEEKRIDFGTHKHAYTVPSEMFDDLLKKEGNKLVKTPNGGWQWNSEEDFQTFKDRMMIKYPAIKPDTLITYDEMMKKPLGSGSAFGSRNITSPVWNVLVKPGDGDDAANRADVLGSYLLKH